MRLANPSNRLTNVSGSDTDGSVRFEGICVELRLCDLSDVECICSKDSKQLVGLECDRTGHVLERFVRNRAVDDFAVFAPAEVNPPMVEIVGSERIDLKNSSRHYVRPPASAPALSRNDGSGVAVGQDYLVRAA